MRFCPFCSAENADELATCQACGRRLPPLPPRRARNAPPTGVQLPLRPTSTTQSPPLRRTGPTIPPPVAAPAAEEPPSPAPARTTTAQLPASARPPATGAVELPPAPAVAVPTVAQVQADDAARRALLGAISPGPAALRREPAPAIPRVTTGEPARRRSDASTTMPPPTPTLPPDPPTQVYAPAAPDDAPTSARIVAPPPTPSRGSRPPPSPTPSPVSVSSPNALSPSPNAPSPPPNAVSPPPNAVSPPQVVVAARPRPSAAMLAATGEPPATRIQRGEAHDRPFTPPAISSVPEIPEPGLVNAARYAARFARARYQRRGAIKVLGGEIKQDTEALDQVLGALGREARTRKVEGRVFSAENTAITAAEERIAQLGREQAEVDARRADENSKFADVERERTTKLSEAERGVDEAQRELLILEGQRRALRDRRKDLERRQKAHLKAAEDQDRQAGAAQMGDQRSELRRAGESHRKEAAALEPERQDADRQLAAIERPIVEATARQDAAKAELDAAKRSLADAREGHTHRLAELDAEHKRKSREIALAEGEIARRLVTLGTLVNLNRIEDPGFAELYQRIDRLRGAITARTTEIEKLTAERDAFDRGMLVRGVSVIAGAFVALIALIVILRAIL